MGSQEFSGDLAGNDGEMVVWSGVWWVSVEVSVCVFK